MITFDKREKNLFEVFLNGRPFLFVYQIRDWGAELEGKWCINRQSAAIEANFPQYPPQSGFSDAILLLDSWISEQSAK